MSGIKKRQAVPKPPAVQGGQFRRRTSIGERLQEHRSRHSPGDQSMLTRDLEYEISRLAPEEVYFLRWLRDGGGYGKRTGKNWMRNDARLLAVGHVKAWTEKVQNTVHYMLAQSGAKALR
jgi:hypothetical protein